MFDFITGATPLSVKSPVAPAGCVAALDRRRSGQRPGGERVVAVDRLPRGWRESTERPADDERE
jgi:hypothetical protein